MIEIRKIQKGEYEEMYILRWEMHGKPFGISKNKLKDLVDKISVIVVAFDTEKKQVVGSARLGPCILSKATIGYLQVMESYRKKGVGRKLMEFLHNEAKKKGIRKLELSARTSVEKFYKELGYVPVGDYYETKKYKIPGIDMEYFL